MSLFGQNQGSGGGGLFGSANKSSPFGSLNLNTGGNQGAGAGGGGGGLFGSAQNQSPSTGGGGLFGSTQNQSSTGTGGGLFGSSTPQPQQGGGLFGSSTTGGGGGGLFGSSTQQGGGGGGGLFGSSTQQGSGGGGLFGSSTSQPQQGGGLFGSSTTGGGGGLFGSSTSQPQQQGGGGLFGSSTTGGGGGLFGSSTSQPQQQGGGGLFGSSTTGGGGGLFGSTQPKPQGSLFGGLGGGQQQQQPQQTGSLFGGLGGNTQQQQQQPQPQSSIFGGSLLGGQQQQTQQQQPQLGQSTMQQNPGTSLWSPGRAITGVHRTVPMQMAIVKDKWDSTILSSPFRSYLYNYVGEDLAPFYQPGTNDDETKWEEALRKRPNTGSVPVLVKGFWELGKRAQRQKDFLSMMQTRLHEINNCLTELLSRHDLKISVRIADARRKHLVLSKRCLSLAAKTQVLRNRGYAMDDVEEELKKKLALLERSVFDPTLNGRGEEIWARMLAIREILKRLQSEVERAGPSAAQQVGDEMDEHAKRTAKKVLDGYNAQIQYLQGELQAVKKDFEEVSNSPGFSGL